VLKEDRSEDRLKWVFPEKKEQCSHSNYLSPVVGGVPF
jgi:hypothetical protein